MNKPTTTVDISGTEFVRTHLQQDLIIIGLRRFLKQLSKTCFICRRWRAQKITPLMVDLPSFQFAEAEKHYTILNAGLEILDAFTSGTEIANRKNNMYVFLPVFSLELCILRFVRHWTQIVAY